MPKLAFVIRIALASVFIFAGWSKLSNQGNTARAFRRFHLPAHWIPIATWLIPLSEIGVGIGLLIVGFSALASRAAFALLSLFSLAILRNVAMGKESACPCFGQHLSALGGWKAVLRNVVLLMLNAVLLQAHRHCSVDMRMFPWWSKLSTRERAGLGSLLGSLLLFSLEGWRRAGVTRFARSADPYAELIPLGTTVSELAVVDSSGQALGLNDVLALTPSSVALIFVHPECEPCYALVESLQTRQDSLPSPLLTPVLIMPFSTLEADHRMFGMVKTIAIKIIYEEGGKVGKLFGITATPSVVVINRSSRKVENLAVGSDAILQLLDRSSTGAAS